MDAAGKTTDHDAFRVEHIASLLAQATPASVELILQRLSQTHADAIRAAMNSNVNQHQEVADRTFAFLKNLPQATLFLAIMRERPQTLAILLSVMPSDLAPRLIRALSETRRVEVLAMLSQLQNVSREVVDELVVGLQQRIKKVCSKESSGTDGLQRVTRILKACDRQTETAIIRSLANDNRDLMEEIQQMLFRFDDIAAMSDGDLCSLTKNVASETWAVALKRTEPNLRERVFASLSIRAIQRVRAEMDYLGHVSPSEIDRAQNQIIDVARRLQEPAPIRRAA